MEGIHKSEKNIRIIDEEREEKEGVDAGGWRKMLECHFGPHQRSRRP